MSFLEKKREKERKREREKERKREREKERKREREKERKREREKERKREHIMKIFYCFFSALFKRHIVVIEFMFN